MNNINKLIDTLRSRNVFAEYYQSGGSPAEIKDRIVNTLRPFFTNHDNLEKHAIDFLVPDYVNLNRVQAKYVGIDRDIRLVARYVRGCTSQRQRGAVLCNQTIDPRYHRIRKWILDVLES